MPPPKEELRLSAQVALRGALKAAPIGAAWFHKDGEGLDVVLQALPVSGRMVLRKAKDKS